MKKLVLILAISFFFKPIFPVVDYIINYQYISTVLCENKDKPQLKCCGKCHLKKALAKVSDAETLGEKSTNSNKKENTKLEIEVLFFQDIKSWVNAELYFESLTAINHNYTNLYSHLLGYSIFHPPLFS